MVRDVERRYGNKCLINTVCCNLKRLINIYLDACTTVGQHSSLGLATWEELLVHFMYRVFLPCQLNARGSRSRYGQMCLNLVLCNLKKK
jgi:hypothetical protein